MKFCDAGKNVETLERGDQNCAIQSIFPMRMKFIESQRHEQYNPCNKGAASFTLDGRFDENK